MHVVITIKYKVFARILRIFIICNAKISQVKKATKEHLGIDSRFGAEVA